ncbi:hypothetical protein RJ53_03020 [Methanocalculus chunghsingensis]|uniref:Uncharacterized protein n=1 Tax=Methanocalculus chunghsingensis TaxID=156457 RepID=A0A8J8B4Z0_9EURY|nr:KEOPS complex subunit Pcc1 [Methanocalculus chunghsingensis]MBR1368529.1 hypothetical protein [Methanocalculus chunghsingensis]
MIRGSGRIRSHHSDPDTVAGSLSPDNLLGMETMVDGEYVETMIVEKPIRSLLASVDDYLMNLSIADALSDEKMNRLTAGNGTDLLNDEED